MFEDIQETGFIVATEAGDFPRDWFGSETGVSLIKDKLALPVEMRFPDDPTGNGRYNAFILRLLADERELNRWTVTYVKESREIVALFETDADAVYFKLLMYA